MIPVHTKWSGGERLASEDMTRWDDQALLPAVREGSEEAFAQLAGRYAPMIQKLASRCRNPLIDTEDLAQEGMLGLLSAARHFQNGSASFGAYAFVCVQHRMFSAVSRASRRQDRTLSDEDWQQEMEKISPEREHGVDPAQQVLQREELYNVTCVVTRYFGGILLGAGGLVRAYAHGAKIAVDAAGRSIKRIWTNVYLPCPYSWYERIRLEVAAFGGMIRETQFGADVELDLLLPEGQTQGFLERVTDLSAGTIEGLIGKQEYRAFPLP